jgi:hypothetical protein
MNTLIPANTSPREHRIWLPSPILCILFIHVKTLLELGRLVGTSRE